MLTVVDQRFQSGDVCRQSGVYEFDGYINGCSDGLPFFDELDVTLNQGQVFPLIASRERMCFWRLLDRAESVE